MSKSTITLNGRDVELKWTNLAQYRLGQLDSFPKLKGHHVYAAICAWVWVMLPREVARLYQSPEDLTEHIDPKQFSSFLDAIIAAQEEGSIGKEGSPKNDTSGKGRKSASKRK